MSFLDLELPESMGIARFLPAFISLILVVYVCMSLVKWVVLEGVLKPVFHKKRVFEGSEIKGRFVFNRQDVASLTQA
jgi:hypothetical protein